jgi:hypothetical protein
MDRSLFDNGLDGPRWYLRSLTWNEDNRDQRLVQRSGTVGGCKGPRARLIIDRGWKVVHVPTIGKAQRHLDL